MNYAQIDLALDFLQPNSYIVLQVPYAEDVQLVYKYLFEKFGEPKKFTSRWLQYDKGKIFIEVVTFKGVCSGRGVEWDKLFFIDRKHDRSYLKYLA